jgi:hypothetical protein
MLMMEMMPKPPRIMMEVKIGALLVPPSDPFGGEVYMSVDVYECQISYPSTRDESI